MSKELSEKELKFLELVVSGVNKTDAVMEAYKPKNRNTGSVMANRLMKKEKVKNELMKRQQMLRQSTIDKEIKFIEALKEYAPPVDVAKRLADLIFAEDKRVADSAIQKYLNIYSLIPDQKIGLYRDYEKEREKILSPADLPKLLEEKRAEEKRKEILAEAEEGNFKEIKENGEEKQKAEEKVKDISN
jgi:phage terminase small subunit